MSRAFLFVLDSFGIGGAPDAAAFGDEGADTLGHIAERVDLQLPNLAALGLGLAAELASGRNPLRPATLTGQWGVAEEISRGKDTPSGHWEMAGVPVRFDWGYFPKTVPCFPPAFTNTLIGRCGLPGLLGNCHASGTEIIAELGEEHVRTGKPIIYTSADSVIQIAAHEESFGLARLLEVCAAARGLSLPFNIGRVIARPFLGSGAGNFARTGNRRDYAVKPPAPTLLDQLSAAGRDVVSIGKIGDIFAHCGTGREVKATGNAALIDATLQEMPVLKPGGLLMANFVDFDMLHGHRRDVPGYAAALEYFDQRLPEMQALLQPGDLMLLTADHGCDPAWPGTEHTRECVPVLCCGPGLPPRALGRRTTFADIGQSVARHLDVAPLATGTSFTGRALS